MNDERIELAKYAIRCALRASALVKEGLNALKHEERANAPTEVALGKVGRLNAAASAELNESLAAIAEFDKLIANNGKKTRNRRGKK
jgi:hypothetical protein